MEDWNTCTLPAKYYDLPGHERKLASIAQGETLLAYSGEPYDFRKDEAMHSRNARSSAPKVTQESYLSNAKVGLVVPPSALCLAAQ